jgi:quercetin dioxygenase-like cupin family protein
MVVVRPEEREMSEAWIESDPHARWKSMFGHGPTDGAEASGSSLLEVAPGFGLGRHTDSAEETVVVVSGSARVELDGEVEVVSAGGLALIPEGVPHQVSCHGEETLRFVAVYASTDVVTRYEDEVKPDGSSERQTVG